MIDERSILQQLAAGEVAAFRVVYDAYEPGIYAVAIQYLKDEALAMDLVQDVFTTIWRKREDLTAVIDFRFYLFTCAKNEALKYMKRVARDEVAAKEYMDKLAAQETDHKEAYTILLHEAIAQLPPKRQEIFRLVKLEGHTYKKVATQLSLSPHTVKTQMLEALKSVRKYIDEKNS